MQQPSTFSNYYVIIMFTLCYFWFSVHFVSFFFCFSFSSVLHRNPYQIAIYRIHGHTTPGVNLPKSSAFEAAQTQSLAWTDQVLAKNDVREKNDPGTVQLETKSVDTGN